MSENFDEVRDLYQSVVLRHGRTPSHQRRLEPFDAAARGDNPMCGDRVEVRLRYGRDGEVSEAAFEARGCAISVASADMMAEAVRGCSPGQVREMAQAFDGMARTGECPDCLGALRALSGVHDYPSRIRCAVLPWTALVQALDDAPTPGETAAGTTAAEAGHGVGTGNMEEAGRG